MDKLDLALMAFVFLSLLGGVFDYIRKSLPKPKLFPWYGIAQKKKGYYPVVLRKHLLYTKKFFAEEWGELCNDPDEAVMNAKALINLMHGDLMAAKQ